MFDDAIQTKHLLQFRTPERFLDTRSWKGGCVLVRGRVLVHQLIDTVAAYHD